jgi:NAD(P)H-nitrite reductase large subunit
MATKNVIIGASAAGVACATKLRELDKKADIIVIEAEEKIPCNRCLLSDVLAGEKTESDISSRNLDFFKQQNIDIFLDTTVIEVLPNEKCVKIQTGQKIFYDKLFLGTGKTGFIPNIPGSELNGVFSFYGLSDVKSILKFIKSHAVKKVTIVGAGLTGLECADALATQGFSVDVIERSLQVLPYQIDNEGAKIVQDLMEKNNINFHPGQIIEEIRNENGTVKKLVLSDDQTVNADMVIFTIGGKPNLKLALRAGIETSPQGILTQNTMQTSDMNIFAGGDGCVVTDLVSGEKIQSCLWSEAALQGITAAHNMLGIHKEYPGMLVVTNSKIF